MNLLPIFHLGATLAFTMAEYTVSELQPAVNICVALTGNLEIDVNATVFTVGGTADGRLQSSTV